MLIKERIDTGYGSRPLEEFVSDLMKWAGELDNTMIQITTEDDYGDMVAVAHVTGWRDATSAEIEARKADMVEENERARVYAAARLANILKEFPDLIKGE